MAKARDIIKKNCKACSKEFMQMKYLKGCCSRECNKILIRKSRPQTFKNCGHCNDRFGPVSHLSQRYCSQDCKINAQTTGRTKKSITTRVAKNAQRLVKYHIDKGNLTRPSICEFCGIEANIEAAHKDYSKPMDVFWLCRPCHVKYDKINPKGGSYSVNIKRNGEPMGWTLGQNG